MKSEKSEAIILQTFPSRERDKLVVFLTPDLGKKKGWAYGARSLNSRFGAALEPLSKVAISFVELPNEEVARIESVDLIRSLFPAQQDLTRSLAATYLAETADLFAQSEDPAELIYRLLDRTSGALLDTDSPLAVVAYAEIWILKVAGIFPSIRECVGCHRELELPLHYDRELQGFTCAGCAGPQSEIVPNQTTQGLRMLLKLPAEEFARVGHEPETLFQIRSFALNLRRNFLGHELKSFDLLQSVIFSAR